MPEAVVSAAQARRRTVRGALRSDMARAGIARAAMLPLGAIAIYTTTRLTVDAVGGRAYGAVALLVTLPYLIPISDLGLGGALTSHLGRHGWQPGISRTVVRNVIGLLGAVAAVLVAVSAALAAHGDLARLLGIDFPHADGTAFAVLVVFAATIPLGVGARILMGLEQQATATTLQALSPVYALVALVVTSAFGTTAVSATIALALGPLVASTSQCVAAAYRVRHRPDERRPPENVAPRLRALVAAAAPLTLMSVAIPLAYQSDRVILAHVGSADALARYSVVGTIYGSLTGVIAAAGVSLWPYFQRLRATGTPLAAAFRRRGVLLATAGVVLAAALLLLGRWVVRLISGEQIVPGYAVYWWFAALLVITALQYPVSMLLIAFDDLWFCAGANVAMLAANVPLSVALVQPMGAAGPAAGSAISTAALVLLPMWLRARRRLGEHPEAPLPPGQSSARGRHRRPDAMTPKLDTQPSRSPIDWSSDDGVDQ